jgi:hypothetical protein
MKELSREDLVELLEGDGELLVLLVEYGILEEDTQGFGPELVETVLVSQTLVRELQINGPGVDVILRMRRQLLVTRRRLAELAPQPDPGGEGK